MALKLVTVCVFFLKMAHFAEASCDASRIQSGMTTCQMKLGTGGGDICSRYAAFTTCTDGLLAPCPASLQDQFKSIMKSATAAYSSQLTGCKPSEGDKPSGSGSGSTSGNNNEASSCSATDLQTKSSSCIQGMTAAAAAGGDACGAWQSYECCLKDAFASCGSDMQSKISTMMSTMKTQYKGMLPGLASCASATCSSQNGAPPAPEEVETTVMANIELADPLAFNVDKYVEAVKKATGVDKLPEAVVKAFEIIVKYVLPDAATMAAAKAAIAKANNVAENQVHVAKSSARRLGAGRRLAMNVDVTITVPDKSKAAAVQKSASNTTTLESELGGAVSITKAPVTTAKVETKVKSAPSATGKLLSQIESAGPAVGGTIKAEVQARAVHTSSSGASTNFSILLAAVVILLRAVF